MQMAIDLAKQSRAEDDRHHPKVGAIIIKDGKFLGSAFRGELGSGDHAEYTLFEKKLKDVELKDSILFTTLEPCTSRNRRKPCSDWIVEKGVNQVFIGMLDPNPRIYHQGVSKLKKQGINVNYFPSQLREEIIACNRDFINQFRANPQPEGMANFDYTNNDGLFTIGNSEYIFDTQWTKATDDSIYLYKDPHTIEGIAIALDIDLVSDIRDASVYDMSSRVRTISEGQFAILKNTNGYYAAIQIIDVKDKSRSDSQDELDFKYWILTDKSCDFSSVNIV